MELDDQGDNVRFRVTGNKAVVEASVTAFNRSLYLALTIFGAGSLLANALAILIACGHSTVCAMLWKTSARACRAA